MRILLCSHVFPPHIGGIETVSAILADQWARLGSSVTVITQTPGGQVSPRYVVIRQPSKRQIRSLAKEADVVFQNNISLHSLIPILSLRKPIAITHQTMLTRKDGRYGWQGRLKCAVLPFCRNIAISKAIAERIPASSIIINNPFEAEEFAVAGVNERSRDIVFMGRLVSDKGCHLVLRALALLKSKGIQPSFTVIGDGPEMLTLKKITAEMGLTNQVWFAGAIREGRGKVVAQHKIMVVPSTWAEPFGVVALEGLAAGCAVVASETGGLPEAVGPCGLLFPNGDIEALATALSRLLIDPSIWSSVTSENSRHLNDFRPEVIARRYLEIFVALLKS